MKKSFVKIVSFVICVSMLLSFTGCASDKERPEIELVIPEKDTVTAGEVASNEKYILSWDDDEKCVVLTDKATGSRWSTTPIEHLDKTKEDKMHVTRNTLESPILINYKVDGEDAVATARAFTHSIYKEEKDPKNVNAYSANYSDGVVTISYAFEEANCVVPVDFTLTDNGLKVSVDTSKIQEGKYEIYSIDLAPYFCSAPHGAEDSYIFYPSGSGALIDLSEPVLESSTYTSEVYGKDASLKIKQELTNEKNIYLPVYGIKKGNDAVCAIITSGVENASVTTVVNATNTGYSTVYANFALRSGDYTFSSVGAADRVIYSESPIEDTVFSVEFYPLTGEDANYAGMAKTYQKYLYGDNKPNEKTADPVYSIQFIGGLLERRNFLGFPYDSLIAMTTYNQAENILTELSSTGVKPNVLLYGFGESGLDIKNVAGGFGLGSAFGSKNELASLTNYCRTNGISSFVDFNLSEFSVGGDGYTTFDSAKSASRMAAYGYRISKGAQILDTLNYDRYRMLSRNKLTQVGTKLYESISKKYDIAGVCFTSISSTAYSDFGYSQYYVKSNMGKQVTEITKIFESGNKRYEISSSGANAYSAVLSSVIFNTPVNSSQQEIFTSDVPFYQIVFKGKAEITSEPVNSGISYQTKKLMALEGGSSMLFTIYQNYDVTATVSPYKDIYGGSYSGNKSTMVAAAEEYSEYYDAIKGQTIVAHDIVADDVRLTTFSNGVKIYVNYSESDYETVDGIVKASDCLIILK